MHSWPLNIGLILKFQIEKVAGVNQNLCWLQPSHHKCIVTHACHCFILQPVLRESVVMSLDTVRYRVGTFGLTTRLHHPMDFVQSCSTCTGRVSKANVDHLLWLYPCWSWTKPPQTPYTHRGPQNRPSAKPGAGVATHAVKGVRLCEERKRTEGSPGWCIWPTPGAGLAAGWLRCRPSGIRQRHCDTFSTSGGSAGSSPWSASPSPSSATHTCSTHNRINTSANKKRLS